MELKPITTAEFKEKMLRPNTTAGTNEFLNYFAPCIQQAENFAVAPFFWLIPNQKNMTLVAASDNISDLTPYTKEEWITKDSFFWMSNFHPDDQGFLGAAIALTIKLEEEAVNEESHKIRLNIYCRMLDAKKTYRWVLLQFPDRYIDEGGKVCSTLILATDLSHLLVDLKCTMTIIETTQKEYKFFATTVASDNLMPRELATITKREHQILLLMTKGLNSPEIAKQLFISYHTVENHKRNLRAKTKTKTSAELIHYIWTNNMI